MRHLGTLKDQVYDAEEALAQNEALQVDNNDSLAAFEVTQVQKQRRDFFFRNEVAVITVV